MTRRTKASLQADLSTGGPSGLAIHGFIGDIIDSSLMLDGVNGAPLLNEAVLFYKTGADMNVTTDQALTKNGTFTNFIVTRIRVVNASTSLTTAAGGVYDTASKGGVALVGAAQAYSALTGATLGLDLTLVAKALGLNSSAGLFLALTTGQGGAATADIYAIGYAVS